MKALKLIAIYQNFGNLQNAEELLQSSKVKLAVFKEDKQESSSIFMIKQNFEEEKVPYDE